MNLRDPIFKHRGRKALIALFAATAAFAGGAQALSAAPAAATMKVTCVPVEFGEWCWEEDTGGGDGGGDSQGGDSGGSGGGDGSGGVCTASPRVCPNPDEDSTWYDDDEPTPPDDRWHPHVIGATDQDTATETGTVGTTTESTNAEVATHHSPRARKNRARHHRRARRH
jgi:hypothetical protein